MQDGEVEVIIRIGGGGIVVKGYLLYQREEIYVKILVVIDVEYSFIS